MSNTKKENNFVFNLLLITIFFNIWFPKAGIKLSGIPLTIGNVFFGITLFFWLLLKLKNKTIKINKTSYLLLLSILYLILKYIIIGDFIENIGYIIPLIIYPLIFFISYDLVDSREKLNKIKTIIIYGFFFLCTYALIQFFVGIDKCAIPGLTVNLSDYLEYGKYWYMTKANGTNLEEVKIVSTYQNGNLFGINLLLFYPIVYYHFKKEKNIKLLIISLILFISSVFLTLSRSCWLGIILFLFLGIFMEKSKNKKGILLKIILVFLCIVSIIFVFKYMPSVYNRFFNTDKSSWINMSGRTEGLITVFKTVNENNSLLAWIIGPAGVIKYSGLAYEMLPLSLFAQVGLVGVFIFYNIMLKTFFNKVKYYENPNKLSLIIWLIVGLIECAFWLPPTALNVYLFLSMFYLEERIN